MSIWTLSDGLQANSLSYALSIGYGKLGVEANIAGV
jgi:hypothetical protein